MAHREELGKRLIAFGEALIDDTTTITELVERASDCGYELQLRLAPNDAPKADET